MKVIYKSFINTFLIFAVSFTSGQTYQLLPDSNADWMVLERSSEYSADEDL